MVDSRLEQVPCLHVRCLRRHIYLDLQPYMCLDMQCPYSNTPFSTRGRWVSHLGLDHDMEPEWNSVKCVLCAEDTGGGKSALTTHLAKHLEEISLSALPTCVGSHAPSEQGDAVLSNSVSEQENSPASIKQSPRMTILDWKKR